MVGFALWPTKANNFSIANTAFRGGGYDIMAEYVTACNVFNIKPGIFYTTKENNYNGIGRGAAIGPKNYTIAEQDRFIVQQLTELMLGKYAPIYELWLDGGLGAEYSQTQAFLLEHGGKWLNHGFPARNGIRWCGNEIGKQAQPNWGASTLLNNLDVRGKGNPYGNVYYPSSADMVLREHCWGWTSWGDMPRITSTRGLVDKYISSSGQGSKFMLNMAPMTFGGLNQDDRKAYAQLGVTLHCLFHKPLVNTSFATSMVATSTGGWEQEWQVDVAGTPLQSHFTLAVRENITAGQRIWSWRLLVSNGTGPGATWTDVTALAVNTYRAGGGSDEELAVSVGFRRTFPNMSLSMPATRMKLVASNVTNASQAPALRDIAIYDWSARVSSACFPN